MKFLLHTCCAPCLIKCYEELLCEEMKPDVFWYNPNIHPYTEYKNRRYTLKYYCDQNKVGLIIEEDYGLREFISKIYPTYSQRCEKCYEWRLRKTCEYASENGYEYFYTTLLISPYQNHELICKIANENAKKYGVKFFYKDFRQYFREGQKVAKTLGIYMQKYCGCIFSEEDRYLKNIKKDAENKLAYNNFLV